MGDEYRTIGEVGELLDLPQHVLRFWETRFKEIAPVKRAGGRRLYRPRDVDLVAAIRRLLYDEGYTIKGVQRILTERGVAGVIADARGGEAKAENEPEAAPALEAAPEPPSLAPPIVVDAPIAASTPFVAAASEPAPIIRALDADDAKRLRAALAELDECRRLLVLTRR